MRLNWARVISLWAAAGILALAYYPFARVDSKNLSQLIPYKFDLSQLTAGSVPYLVSDKQPDGLGKGDSMTALITQLQLAAGAWDSVETSSLRLRYGGLFTPATPQVGPRIEISFDDLPPGVLAHGGPVVYDEVRRDGDGKPFVPVQRAIIGLSADVLARGTYSERFFGTVVHEFGHSVGLQHSYASGAMSTETTRAITRGRPLFADDAAGISSLYPTAGFLKSTGSVTGRVTMSGAPVNMASVAAVQPNGVVVTGITTPDGSYRIDGLPPGQYFVFVQPVSPPETSSEVTPGNIRPPVDENGRVWGASSFFGGRFYPNTVDPKNATPVNVTVGETSGGIDFAVQKRSAPAVYAVASYNFPGRDALIKPGFLIPDYVRGFLLVTGQGVTTADYKNVAPGLSIYAVGGSANVENTSLYSAGYLRLDFWFSPLAAEGSRHLVFVRDNDAYLLPCAFDIVRRTPPDLSAATVLPRADGPDLVQLAGKGLTASTQVFFDGVSGSVIGADDKGNLSVEPPPGSTAYSARVVAVNPDRQSSLFWDATAKVITYQYPAQPEPSLTLSLPELPAGTEALVEIRAANMNFLRSTPVVSFGTSDVAVRHLWVADSNRLLADVAVSPLAASASVNVSVQSGLQSITLRPGFQVLPANRSRASLHAQPLDKIGGNAVPALIGQSLTLATTFDIPELSLETCTVRVNSEPTPCTAASPKGISFVLSPYTSVGTATVVLAVGGNSGYPIILPVRMPDPKIISLATPDGVPVTDGGSVKFGTTLVATVANLASPGAAVKAESISLVLADAHFTAIAAAPVDGQVVHTVTFVVPGSLPTDKPVGLSIGVDGRTSATRSLQLLQ